MKITDIKKGKENIIFSIKSSKEEFVDKENKAITSLSSKLKIDGFRKGKIPFNEAKKRLDLDLLAKKLVDFFLKDAVNFVINSPEFKKHDEEIIDAPPNADIKSISFDEKEISIEFTFDMFPSITVDGYKNIKLTTKKKEITQANVNDAINVELSKNALSVPKDGKIEKNDIVIFDFKGFLNDKPFQGGESKDYELKIGSNSFIPGFEEKMIGLKKGEEKSINVKFPKDYHQKDLANKDVRFDLKIHSISTLENEALDNDFVKSLNIKSVSTVDDYKKYMKNDLSTKADKEYNEEKQKEYIDKLLKIAKLNFVPESLIKVNTDKSIINLKNQLKSYGIKDFDMYFKMIGMNEEQFYEKQKETSKNQLIITMALDKIAELEKCKVTKSELDARLSEMAVIENLTLEQVKEKLQENIYVVEQQILQEKTIKKLIEN
ncbi:MAG: trigger factor [Malacoplasma sp.]